VGPERSDEDLFSRGQSDVRRKLRAQLHASAEDLHGALKGPTETVFSLPMRIAALGFGGDAAKVFDLLPLVHVAWADTSIQAGERAAILNLLKLRGVGPGDAWTVMETLLEERPSQAYLDVSLDVLKELLAERGDDGRTIVGLCILVAEAAGGFLGIGTVSKVEREAIAKIAERLGSRAQEEFHARLG
jgi:hypothetical protein